MEIVENVYKQEKKSNSLRTEGIRTENENNTKIEIWKNAVPQHVTKKQN